MPGLVMAIALRALRRSSARRCALAPAIVVEPANTVWAGGLSELALFVCPFRVIVCNLAKVMHLHTFEYGFPRVADRVPWLQGSSKSCVSG
jgi:hypothetical protein